MKRAVIIILAMLAVSAFARDPAHVAALDEHDQVHALLALELGL
mgnify:CR=1 FL=1